MFIRSNDAQLLAYRFGAGEKTLVTHGGWVGSGELWLPTIERLGPKWNAVAYDHRGTGATVCEAPHIAFEHLVDDLFCVLDRLGIGRCVLAGESSGAMVVLEAALRRPERFSGLVLVGARISGKPTANSARLLQGCRADFPATMSGFVDACVPEEDCAAERAFGKKIVMRSSAKDAVELLECLERFDHVPRMSEIDIPALILHGARDVVAPIDNARTLADKLPDVKLAIHDDAGHVPTLTRPQWVADQIEARFG